MTKYFITSDFKLTNGAMTIIIAVGLVVGITCAAW
jgi:hypothetical protein